MPVLAWLPFFVSPESPVRAPCRGEFCPRTSSLSDKQVFVAERHQHEAAQVAWMSQGVAGAPTDSLNRLAWSNSFLSPKLNSAAIGPERHYANSI